MSGQPIRSIAIVGGGTAGWSAAACLCKFLQKRDVSITLIESAAIGTVGVGEASIPNIRNFNAYIGLNELDFLESTGGTFKLGIRFDGWRNEESSFFHPFSAYGVPLGDLDFHQCFFEARRRGFEGDLEEFCLAVALAKQDRFSQPSSDASAGLSQFGYAYHFDASRYAQRLRAFASSRGVEQVEGLVTDVKLEPETGFIEAVELESGESIAADLFIDCSGFRALLIEGTLQTGYVSWRKWLPCDRAIALPSERAGNSLAPYTIATARKAGWSWNIPLQHRTGNGYVYSSAHISDEDAHAELLAAIGGEPVGEPNWQRFEAGMRSSFWNRNCVSLGLASGFIEPLESTSINLVHRALSILMDHFPGVDCDPRLLRRANEVFAGEQERIRDFIILHYKLSQRDDSQFWRDVSAMEIPQTLQDKIDLFQANGTIAQGRFESFREESWLTMYNGFGLVPETLDTRLAEVEFEPVLRALSTIRENISKGAEAAVPHADFVERFCPAPRPEAFA